MMAQATLVIKPPFPLVDPDLCQDLETAIDFATANVIRRRIDDDRTDGREVCSIAASLSGALITLAKMSPRHNEIVLAAIAGLIDGMPEDGGADV